MFTHHDYLYPETFHYLLSAVSNALVPSLYYKAAPAGRLGFDLDGYELRTVCSSFHPRQIQICVDRPEDIYFETRRKYLWMGRQSASLSSGARVRREGLSVSFKAISASKNCSTRSLVCVAWSWMMKAAIVLGCYCHGLIVSTRH